jgi:hypothetical protein
MAGGLASELTMANPDIVSTKNNAKGPASGVKRVVFIMSLPLSPKIIGDFFIQEILDEGIAVEYWNVAQLLFQKEYPTPEENRKEIKCYEFHLLSDFRKAIVKSERSTTVFIPQITYDHRSFKIFTIISKADCCTFFFARGALPVNVNAAKERRLNVVKLLSYKLPFKIASKITQKIRTFYLLESKKRGWVKPHNVLFAAGRKAQQVIGAGGELDFRRSKVVPINYFDYDVFQLEAMKQNTNSPANYCVFLDEYFTRHPDFIALNIPLINEHSYFSHLNNFFAAVEESLNIKVVIAAHPKSEYSENPFNGRTLIKHETSKLVAGSAFVLCHMSSSLSFAILNKKPLVFISCKEIETTLPAYHSYISFLAKYLNADFYDISENVLLREGGYKRYNEQAYENYALNYLTNGDTKNVTTKEIFIHYLRNHKFNVHA